MSDKSNLALARYPVLCAASAKVAAFTGLATYDDFANLDDDISEILLLSSPRETPFLDALNPPARPATNVEHKWKEQELGPDRIIASTAINSATAEGGAQVNGLAHLLQVGMMLEMESSEGTTEILRITSIPGPNSIRFVRNQGSRGVNSLVAGGTIFVIGTAEEEGADTDGDVSRIRTERSNYTQIFKKPVKLSGSRQATLTAPNIGSEINNQVTLRTIELLRDLEKSVIRGVAINSIGSDDNRRTMNGVRAFVTSIDSVIVHSSFAADPLLYMNTLMQNAWTAGARDLDVLHVGADWAKAISGTNASKTEVTQSESGIRQVIETVETDFGQLRKILSPWMPPKSMLGVSTRRIFVPNLTARNFTREALGKDGDSTKLQIIGEYTLEIHHPDKMFQGRGQ